MATDYLVVEDYSGRACDKRFSWSVRFACFCCADEERLPLTAGERVKVTRTEGDWVYGWRESSDEADGQGKKKNYKRCRKSEEKRTPNEMTSERNRSLDEESKQSGDAVSRGNRLDRSAKIMLLKKGWFPAKAVQKIKKDKKNE